MVVNMNERLEKKEDSDGRRIENKIKNGMNIDNEKFGKNKKELINNDD